MKVARVNAHGSSTQSPSSDSTSSDSPESTLFQDSEEKDVAVTDTLVMRGTREYVVVNFLSQVIFLLLCFWVC